MPLGKPLLATSGLLALQSLVLRPFAAAAQAAVASLRGRYSLRPFSA